MKKLGGNKLLAMQFKYYWQLATFTNTLLPIMIGLLIDFSVQGAIAGILFIGLGRAVQQQATFLINSVESPSFVHTASIASAISSTLNGSTINAASPATSGNEYTFDVITAKVW